MAMEEPKRWGASSWQALSTADLPADPLLLPVELQEQTLKEVSSAGAVRQALAQNASYSAQLDTYLRLLLDQCDEHIASSQNLLCSLGQQIHLIEDEAIVLERRLRETGSTAERISESVRRLDVENERVERARAWTEMVANLKASLQSLSSSITQQDYAAATQHCVRAMAIDAEVLHSNFAASMVPSSDNPQPPPVQLETLRKRLLEVYTEKFVAATDAKDTVAATTFFKMFPQIGWKEEGLSVYREYARSVVRERGRAVTDALATSSQKIVPPHSVLLTRLFEDIALLIDQHQPLVDRFYGTGDFAKSVMPGLQDECDRLGKRVCDAWYEEKNVARKLEEAKSYKFTYVASIGKQGKVPTRSNTSSIKGPGGFNIPGRPSTPSITGPGGTEAQDGEADVDTREADRIIAELASMGGRWGTYRLFLGSRLSSISHSVTDPEAYSSSELKDFRRPTGGSDSVERLLKTSEGKQEDAGQSIARESKLGVRITSLVEEVYVPLESWFLRCSVEKAHRMDTTDLSARPLVSSLLDDIFYLVRMVLARSVSTANLDVLSGMCRNVRYIVDEDFVQALVRKMDGVYKASSGSMNVEGPRKDAASREMRSTFVVYLNILATSAEYMSRIVAELSSEDGLSKHYVGKELPLAVSTIQGLSILIPRIRNAVRTHLELMYTTLLRPKLKQVLSDSLRDISYLINEEDFSRQERESGNASLLVRRFTRGWDHVLHSSNYRQLFLAENWESFLRLAIDSVVQSFEEWAMSAKYSELGALCFDKDVRALISFLSSQSSVGGLRDRFARLTQISYLVNLDDDAAEEQIPSVTQAGVSEAQREDEAQVAWRLSAHEVNTIRQRRVAW